MQRVITELLRNVVVKPDELNDGLQTRTLLAIVKKIIERKVVNNWYIVEVKSIVSMNAPIHNKESEYGDFYVDCVYSARAIMLEDHQTIFYGCTYRVTADMGVLMSVPKFNMNGIIPNDHVAISDERLALLASKNAPPTINVMMVFHRKAAMSEAKDFICSLYFFPERYVKIVRQIDVHDLQQPNPRGLKDATFIERVIDFDTMIQFKMNLIKFESGPAVPFIVALLSPTPPMKETADLYARFFGMIIKNPIVSPEGIYSSAVARGMKKDKSGIVLKMIDPPIVLDMDTFAERLTETEIILKKIILDGSATIASLPVFPASKLAIDMICILARYATVYLIRVPLIIASSCSCIIMVLEREPIPADMISAVKNASPGTVALFPNVKSKARELIDSFNFDCASNFVSFLDCVEGVKKMFRDKIPAEQSPVYLLYKEESDRAVARIIEAMQE